MADNLRAVVVRRLQERLPDTPLHQLEEDVDRAGEYFCSKTKRKTVPLTALYLWLDMALRVHSLNASPGDAGKVTSIKRGDTTIQYSDSAVAEAMTDIESRVRAYRVVRTG